MLRRISLLMLLVAAAGPPVRSRGYLDSSFGRLLEGSTDEVALWWASSGWKVSPDRAAPRAKAPAMVVRAAANEAEAAQLVVRPSVPLNALTIRPSALAGPGGAEIPADRVEVLEVRYVNVTVPTDKSSVPGLWPDPLVPLAGAIDLEPGRNHPFWIRVKVPRRAKRGLYSGRITLAARGYAASVAVEVEVYGFSLPDRMTCTTAFGFSAGNVFRYQKLSDPQDKRAVLEKYWTNFSDHHISPYDPAPLDRIKVTWPDVRPEPSRWEGATIVTNEKHGGERSLLVFDDRTDRDINVSYKPLIKIPPKGLRLRFWYRTAIPQHQFIVTLNHYDASGKWIYGANHDIDIEGNGHWQEFDRTITTFPKAAVSARLSLRAAPWTEAGEKTGLVWFDDVCLTDAATGEGLLEGGDFEPAALPAVEADKLRVKFDFSAWDRAMTRAIDHYHFNSFRLSIPGLGGGTFHARYEPQLLGFKEDAPHYKLLLGSYCSQLEQHLRAKGWLDEAFIYWFDEPSPKDYGFVNNGFAKLKQYCPAINRMLTEQVEPELVGGPNIWCPVSHNYNHEAAEQRRKHGEKFWWYICTGPKAPYCTLFIDHPGTELRVWLWQSWQRKIEGILVWQTNYWTSSAAYPDRPQNPYEDPMGWRSGYSTPKGQKRPWGNGDGRFIYPPPAAADANPPAPVLDGPVDSIRWEMLRDGIEDYEYLALLKRLLRAAGEKLTAERARRYAALLEVPGEITSSMTSFTKDPAPIEARRDEVAGAIAELSELERAVR